MNEKKLTDEDVVKALECCSKSWDCNNCKRNKENNNRFICSENLMKDCLDLIHRLQGENERLTEKNESLEERNRILKKYKSMWAELDTKNAEIQKQVEKLKEENEYLDMVAKQALTDYQNTQVQVDELTVKKDLSIAHIEKELTNYLFMSCSYGALVCGKMSFSIAQEQAKRFAPFLYSFIQQAVKDTAKEICEMIDGTCISSKGYLCSIISKRYGVEVE